MSIFPFSRHMLFLVILHLFVLLFSLIRTFRIFCGNKCSTKRVAKSFAFTIPFT
eukprot:UN21640